MSWEIVVGIVAGVLLAYAALLLLLLIYARRHPETVTMIGYADDAVIVALVLRSVLKRAGAEALERHWPGSPAGLEVILRAAGPVRRTP